MAGLPLDGVRVVEITVVYAGPHVTQLLAEWGAEVIRVEPRTRIQPVTRGVDRRPPPRETQIEIQKSVGGTGFGYPDFEPYPEPWNRSAAFTSSARNKLSMTADVMTPEGREAFLRLIDISDVFVENNVPGTIDRAGIGYDVLHERNPRLVVLRMPAFGLDGPYANYRCMGMHAEAIAGHTYIRSYPDEALTSAGDTVTSDAVSGVLGALTISMALRHARRTGRGQLIEQPLTESFLPILGDFILDYTANGRDAGPQANRHRAHAPHNYYPCRTDGDYVGIDCDSDAAWDAICDFFDADDLRGDERFRTAAARYANQAELDRALSAYTRQHEQRAIFLGLQAKGVIAGPVQNEAQAFACPQLGERGFFEELTSPHTGTHKYPGLNMRMAHTPNALRTPAPGLGEHNEYVYRDLLGYTDAEYQALLESEQVGEGYAPGVVPDVGGG